MTKRGWPNVLGKTILSAAVLVALSGFSCEPSGKLKLSGMLASADGEGTARFRIHAEQCGDPEAGITGLFKYRDSNADVKINGTIILANTCSEVPGCEDYCAGTDLLIAVDYGPGDQSALANLLGVCLDEGEGVFTIGVFTGPYAGYQNAGPVTGGTQSYTACDEAGDD